MSNTNARFSALHSHMRFPIQQIYLDRNQMAIKKEEKREQMKMKKEVLSVVLGYAAVQMLNFTRGGKMVWYVLASLSLSKSSVCRFNIWFSDQNESQAKLQFFFFVGKIIHFIMKSEIIIYFLFFFGWEMSKATNLAHMHIYTCFVPNLLCTLWLCVFFPSIEMCYRKGLYDAKRNKKIGLTCERILIAFRCH